MSRSMTGRNPRPTRRSSSTTSTFTMWRETTMATCRCGSTKVWPSTTALSRSSGTRLSSACPSPSMFSGCGTIPGFPSPSCSRGSEFEGVQRERSPGCLLCRVLGAHPLPPRRAAPSGGQTVPGASSADESGDPRPGGVPKNLRRRSLGPRARGAQLRQELHLRVLPHPASAGVEPRDGGAAHGLARRPLPPRRSAHQSRPGAPRRRRGALSRRPGRPSPTTPSPSPGLDCSRTWPVTLRTPRPFYEKAAKLAPDDFLVQYRYAQNLLDDPRPDSLRAARVALNRAVALRPDFGEAWARLGYTTRPRNRWTRRPSRSWRRPTACCPRAWTSPTISPLAYARTGQRDQAAELIEHVLAPQADPDEVLSAREALL